MAGIRCVAASRPPNLGCGPPHLPPLLLPMTETDARAVLLTRSFERAALLAADDAAWAGREARRLLGEAAPPEAWLAQRAQLALRRLLEREPALRKPLAAAQAQLRVGPVLALLALVLGFGLLGDGLGRGHQINLLALPLLGLLAWNLVVYALLALQAAWPRAPASAAAPTARATPAWPALLVQTLSRWQAAASRLLHGAGQPAGPLRAALASFAADCLAHCRPLVAWRGTALLHACAAALALGTVVALYARGLVFDYQAGWDSSFLQPVQVRQLLVLLLGPASALSGLPLPDAAALGGLRLAAGGGAPAAPWIHRWALSLLMWVVLPRLVLAGLAWRRARRLANDLPMPDDPALQQLMQAEQAVKAGGVAQRAVAVLPYSYRLDTTREAAVATALTAWLGSDLSCDVQPGLPLGAEDQLASWLPATLARLRAASTPPAATADAAATAPAAAPMAPLLVLLFALTATPERESHGALVQALVQALPKLPAPRPQLRVAVDESGYRQRLSGPDGAQRLAQRRAAWESLLLGLGVVPGFIDLSGQNLPA